MTDPRECVHQTIFFGSGGYRIICSECGTTWAAEGDVQRNKMLNEADIRVAAAPAFTRGDDDVER